MDNNNNNLFEENNSYELLLNTFMIYYKMNHPDENIKSMFDYLSNDEDTNKPLECFYQSIIEYKASNYKESVEYNEEQSKNFDELYILNVNEKNIRMSDNILSLIIDVINEYYDEEWNIIDK